MQDTDYQSKCCLILNVITCCNNSYWIRKGRIANGVKLTTF